MKCHMIGWVRSTSAKFVLKFYESKNAMFSEKAICAVLRLNLEIITKADVLSPNNVLECWMDEIKILTWPKSISNNLKLPFSSWVICKFRKQNYASIQRQLNICENKQSKRPSHPLIRKQLIWSIYIYWNNRDDIRELKSNKVLAHGYRVMNAIVLRVLIMRTNSEISCWVGRGTKPV